MFPIKLKCKHCPKEFSYRHGLKRHSLSAHPNLEISLDKPKNNPSLNCPECDFIVSSFTLLTDHLKNSHDIQLTVERHNFRSIEEFISWKQILEQATSSLFVKFRGRVHIRHSRGAKEIYMCHRSGRPREIRHTFLSRVKISNKTPFSNKIGAVCPARIKAIINEEGEVAVEFLATHVGHPQEPSLFSMKREAEVIEEDDDACASAKNGLHTLVSVDDVSNLRLANLGADENELSHLERWVNENPSHVLLYKPPGCTVESIPKIESQDFYLAVMSQDQADLLNQMSDNLCLDWLQRTPCTQYDLAVLSTTSSESPRLQAMPLAFLFVPQRSDYLSVFIEMIVQRLGRALTPQLVLTEDPMAWEILGDAHTTTKLRGSWTVERDWKSNLKSIPDKILQEEVYDMLTALMVEKDASKFHTDLKELLEDLSTKEGTSEFAAYFAQTFSASTTDWAFCHRSDFDKTVDESFARLNKTLTYIYNRGKSLVVLDKTLQYLMDMFKNRLVALKRSEVSDRLIELRKKHKAALKTASATIITELEGATSWSVWKKDGQAEVVREIDPSCGCYVACEPCKSCIHRYSCTCSDSAVNMNMCKHIHLIGLSRKQAEKPTETHVEQLITETEIRTETLPVQMVVEETVVDETALVERGKIELEDEFKKILESLRTMDDVNLLKNSFQLIVPTLNAMRAHHEQQLQQQHQTGNAICGFVVKNATTLDSGAVYEVNVAADAGRVVEVGEEEAVQIAFHFTTTSEQK